MEKFPEHCPVQEILKDIEQVLELLDKILNHCESCEYFRKE